MKKVKFLTLSVFLIFSGLHHLVANPVHILFIGDGVSVTTEGKTEDESAKYLFQIEDMLVESGWDVKLDVVGANMSNVSKYSGFLNAYIAEKAAEGGTCQIDIAVIQDGGKPMKNIKAWKNGYSRLIESLRKAGAKEIYVAVGDSIRLSEATPRIKASYEEGDLDWGPINQYILSSQEDLGVKTIRWDLAYEAYEQMRAESSDFNQKRFNLTADGLRPTRVGHRVMALSTLHEMGIDLSYVKNTPFRSGQGNPKKMGEVTDEIHTAIVQSILAIEE